jgi:hypothetical protein
MRTAGVARAARLWSNVAASAAVTVSAALETLTVTSIPADLASHSAATLTSSGSP